MDELQGISWHDGRVRILDQTRLPEELVALEISDYQGIIRAITGMNVRGAPAIGIAAAYGIVLAVWSLEEADRPAFLQRVNQASEALARSRPTARNLFWALERMRAALMKLLSRPLREIKLALLEEAQRLHADDIERCRAIGRFGAALLPQTTSIMTHCNAGAFATGGFGTALGVIRTAVSQGKKVQVYACETRPLLQGSRITAWELAEEEIPVTVLCDSMAAYAMARGLVQMVIVGADRIARNGDAANKIGTYGLAILARHHRIPFYVAAPLSTFDLEIRSGDHITIEQRAAAEVELCGGMRAVPEGVPVLNPSFDVTPAKLIDAFITEKGIIRPPFEESLTSLQVKA
ncbi:MAG: Methylthioribose-1-phosphate isomerase [bacterium ADurb.Bin431]|nr:MAG: Methylthioribose-1-phosphate isomerase [bacterium ADurb.Bin431]HNY92718.1 S-methyl-5-thioribose-1-phosphate isomerase [bacterium]HOC24446.1 S-methyl-5-thioribose-1-phosphate isomerase [bacterium]HOH07265.1 S-methyl-5-thioribose-1-phosphate isomerase [bacterium]HOY44988.1 S-methyl-5-thioribose-1-phosphate isomerase [bacterium]